MSLEHSSAQGPPPSALLIALRPFNIYVLRTAQTVCGPTPWGGIPSEERQPETQRAERGAGIRLQTRPRLQLLPSWLRRRAGSRRSGEPSPLERQCVKMTNGVTFCAPHEGRQGRIWGVSSPDWKL